MSKKNSTDILEQLEALAKLKQLLSPNYPETEEEKEIYREIGEKLWRKFRRTRHEEIKVKLAFRVIYLYVEVFDDLGSAYRWLEAIDDLGYTNGGHIQYLLGTIYYFGQHAPENNEKAERFLFVALKFGILKSAPFLVTLYFLKKNPEALRDEVLNPEKLPKNKQHNSVYYSIISAFLKVQSRQGFEYGLDFIRQYESSFQDDTLSLAEFLKGCYQEKYLIQPEELNRRKDYRHFLKSYQLEKMPFTAVHLYRLEFKYKQLTPEKIEDYFKLINDSPGALCILADFYLAGDGLPKNKNKAMELFFQAGLMNYPYALRQLNQFQQ